MCDSEHVGDEGEGEVATFDGKRLCGDQLQGRKAEIQIGKIGNCRTEPEGRKSKSSKRKTKERTNEG